MLPNCTDMRQHDVNRREPMFYSDRHLPPTFDLWKKLLTFSLSLSLSQKVIMVLIMLELHEPYWVLVCLTPTLLLSKQLCMSFISSYSWSCSCCSHSYYFSKFKVLNVLQAHILVALPRSYYSFKLTFLMFSKLTFLLFFPVAFLLLFSIIFLLLQACVLAIPSSHSYCTFQLCSWVTLFLLLINIPLSIILVTHQHTIKHSSCYSSTYHE